MYLFANSVVSVDRVCVKYSLHQDNGPRSQCSILIPGRNKIVRSINNVPLFQFGEVMVKYRATIIWEEPRVKKRIELEEGWLVGLISQRFRIGDDR